MSRRGVSNREMSPNSAIKMTAPVRSTPRSAWIASTTGDSRQHCTASCSSRSRRWRRSCCSVTARTYSWNTICWGGVGHTTSDSQRRWAAVDAVTYTYEDDRLAYGEQRFVTLGLLREVLVSIVHTEEGNHIHVISMRKATKREREIYFESIAN